MTITPRSTAASIIVPFLFSFLISSLHAFTPPLLPLSCPSSSNVGSSCVVITSSSLKARFAFHRSHHLALNLEPSEPRNTLSSTSLGMKIDEKRRKQLGISDDEDEYDLDRALSVNTDAGITKIIAGSFILVMIALLVVGLV